MMTDPKPTAEDAPDTEKSPAKPQGPAPAEEGGAPGPEPTRYGDWERKGVAVDF